MAKLALIMAAMLLALQLPFRQAHAVPSVEAMAKARELFKLGLELQNNAGCPRADFTTAPFKYEANQAAIAKFLASIEFYESAATWYRLALSYECVQKTSSAWTTFLRSASVARTEARSEIAEMAEQKALELKPQLTYLELRLSQRARAQAPTIFLDKDELSPGSLNTRLPIDPGSHKLKSTAPNHQARVQSFVVEHLQNLVVGIQVLEPIPTPPATPLSPPVPTAKPDQASAAWSPLRKATLIGGIGLAAGGTVLYLFSKTRFDSALRDVETLCLNDRCRDTEELEAYNQAYNSADSNLLKLRLGLGTLGIGLALTGAATWLMAGSDNVDSSTHRVKLLLQPPQHKQLPWAGGISTTW